LEELNKSLGSVLAVAALWLVFLVVRGLWRLMWAAARAMPGSVERLARTAGSASGKVERTARSAASAFHEGRNNTTYRKIAELDEAYKVPDDEASCASYGESLRAEQGPQSERPSSTPSSASWELNDSAFATAVAPRRRRFLDFAFGFIVVGILLNLVVLLVAVSVPSGRLVEVIYGSFWFGYGVVSLIAGFGCMKLKGPSCPSNGLARASSHRPFGMDLG
jgi:hypothetical protein